MIRFGFQGRDPQGKSIKGEVEGATASDAAKLLRERGVVVISLSPKKALIFESFQKFFQKVSLDELAVFTREFATMIEAGISITDALSILKSQASPAMEPVVTQILADVEGGSSLASALEKHKDVFSLIYIALVQAGEGGGVLDKILVRLADNLEEERDFRGKIKGMLIYPAIVVVGMMIVSGIMAFFVIPKLTPLFTEVGATLPLPTKIVIILSEFGRNFWWLILMLIIAGSWLAGRLIKLPKTRAWVDAKKLNIPIIGPLIRKIILTEMARTLGLLVGAGVSILDALKIISGVVGNSVIKAAVERSAVEVEKGFSVAASFSQDPDIFPPILTHMMAVGEETGKLDYMLMQISHIFEQETDQAVKNLTATIGPLITVVLAVGVGVLALAVFLPIYQLPQQIGL